MTVKALKKQLMAAIAMVVVALVALSSSTYAWFAANNTVTATGMTVTATADNTLSIAASSDGAYSTIATVSSSAATMKPVTSADGVTFGILTGAVKVDNPASSNATWSGEENAFQATDISSVTTTSESVYTLDTSYYLKWIGASDSDTHKVYVKSITIAGGDDSSDFKKSIRVSVTVGSQTKIFNPLSGDLNDGKVGSYADSAWALVTPSYATVDTASAEIATLTSKVSQEAVIHVWFEGQDTKCYTNNVNTNGITVQVDFSTEITSNP